MKPDRLIFDTTTLPNGITVHLYPYPVPFAECAVIFPFGSGHNTGNILPGTFHFFEHCMFNRSKRFPEHDGFSKHIQLRGGYVNAATSKSHTTYYLDSHVTNMDEDFSDFIDHLYSVTFNSEDIAKERGIIANERKRKEKYYPGTDEVSKYEKTVWAERSYMPIRQIFGLDSDMAQMDEAYLSRMYDLYRTRDVQVIVGGTFNKEKIITKLSQIETKPVQKLESIFTPLEWKKKDYHEAAFEGARRHVYNFAVVVPDNSFEMMFATWFMGQVLVNHVHGPLYEWMRHELAESYDLSFTRNRFENGIYVEISIPLSSPAKLELVRRELRTRIRTALSDKELIAREYKRIDAREDFSLQRISEFVGSAETGLQTWGHIVSEAETRAMSERVATSEYLLNVYDTYFTNEAVGELYTYPKQYNWFQEKLVNFAKRYILGIQ